MIFTINGHSDRYETRNIIALFFQGTKVEILQDSWCSDGEYINTKIEETDSGRQAVVEVSVLGQKKTAKTEVDESENKATQTALCKVLYRLLADITGHRPPWGMLTGIRPVKFIHNMRKNGMSDSDIIDKFILNEDVSRDKIELCIETANYERDIISRSTDNSFSLYISIPFCPSRCSYCSFISHSAPDAAHMLDSYIEKLAVELKYTADIAKELRLKPQTVYIGGGTPSILSVKQMSRLLDSLTNCFDLNEFCEFTFEAGRPDTLDVEKLKVLHSAGVSRLCINPQTMDDKVLELIGRRHTAQDVERCFDMARNIGFSSINMDMIAGLPGDTVSSFNQSAKKVIRLKPENITVHALSAKRASNLVSADEIVHDTVGAEVSEMTDMSYTMLKENGYHPYYLYRQKNTVGNLENIGYSLDGHDGIYNVYIMDETHSILSCGAGGVTKLKSGKAAKIERVFNYKYPYEYLRRFDDILQRKEYIARFYKKYL